MRNSLGFTLLELLLVAALIGILAAVTLTAMNPQRRFQDARDVGRKMNIAQIANAIEVYNIVYGGYPVTLADLVPNELKLIPPDPSDFSYSYDGAGCVSIPLEVGHHFKYSPDMIAPEESLVACPAPGP